MSVKCRSCGAVYDSFDPEKYRCECGTILQPTLVDRKNGEELRLDGIFFEDGLWWYKFLFGEAKTDISVCDYRIPTLADFNEEAKKVGVEISCYGMEYDNFLADCQTCESEIQKRFLGNVDKDDLRLLNYIRKFRFPKYTKPHKYLSQLL